MPEGNITADREEDWQALLETTIHGHACEIETSVSLANHPHLVKMDRVPQEPATPLGRMANLPPTYSGIWWYSDYPDHYAGDARVSTIAKGQAMVQLQVDSLAEYIAAVKADEVVPTLTRAFFHKAKQVGA
jgi:creatinine amidohydrolase